MSSDSNSKIDENGLAEATEKLKVKEGELDSESDDASPPKVAHIGNTGGCIPKKSTATPEMRQPPAASTRRQVALANSAGRASTSPVCFMESSSPKSNAPERRKSSLKVKTRRSTGNVPAAIYDKNGIHIESGIDLCDCLQMQCPGCYYPCPKCNSRKCGPDCRCNRTYTHEMVKYEGYDWVVQNPLLKK